jgi:pilus assembly protein Flp/PilA
MLAAAVDRARENAMKRFFGRFVRDEVGATAIEYGLIAALVAVALIAGARGVGSQVSTTFNTAKTTMKTA